MAFLFSRLNLAPPVFRKIAVGATASFVGDGIAQTFTGDEHTPYDVRRGLAFTAYGACVVGACNHYLFLALERRFSEGKGRSLKIMLQKVGITQGIVVPFIYYPMFYSLVGTIRGYSANSVAAQIRREHMQIQLVNWSLSIPTTMIMFTFVPLRFQVAFSGVNMIAFSSVLSFMTNRGMRAISVEG